MTVWRPRAAGRREPAISSTGLAAQLPKRLLWMAFLSGAFGLAMSAQINFIVPLRARELGASFEAIGLIVGAGALAPALLSVPLGSVIDRIGPRQSFIVGTAGAAGLSLTFLLVTNYWWFLALQPFLGVARNLGWVASQGYITSLGTAEERASLTGKFGFFSNGGQMVGPVMIGGVAQLVGFRWAFVFLAVYAGVFAIVGLLLAETRAEDHDATRQKQGSGLGSALQLLALRGIQVALLLTFARLWTTWVYTTFFPVYLVDTGLQPGVVGTVMATSGLVGTVMAPTAGYWSRRLQQQTVAAIGLACGATALMLAPHAGFIPMAYVVPMLVGVGQGLSLPLLMSIVTTAAPEGQRGVALGLRAMINQTAATAAPVIVGPIIGGLGVLLGFTTGGLVAAVMVISSRLLHAVDLRAQRATAEAQPADADAGASGRDDSDIEEQR